MVSIARKNLFQDIPRCLVAQAGIMFAVGLVTIQTGLLNGFTRSSSYLIDHSDADIWVTSKEMRHLDLTLPMPYERVAQAQKVAGVARAEALINRGSIWRNLSEDEIAPIRVIGFDPNGQLFLPQPLEAGKLTSLNQPYNVFLDKSDLESLTVNQIGDVGLIGSFRAEVTGLTQGMRSIVTSPFVMTSLTNAQAYVKSPITTPKSNPPAPSSLTAADEISYVLVQAKPGEDLQALKQRLATALPNTRVLTKTEMSELTRAYWQKSTGVGFILGMGAIVGVVVGTVVVGQILYSSVSDHLKEFGTLKAMGSSNWFIYGVIIEQAIWMAILGYVPGMALCLGLGAWTMQARAIEILIGPATAGGVFGLTIVMCIGAAVFAIQKVTHVDPAMVFKS